MEEQERVRIEKENAENELKRMQDKLKAQRPINVEKLQSNKEEAIQIIGTELNDQQDSF